MEREKQRAEDKERQAAEAEKQEETRRKAQREREEEQNREKLARGEFVPPPKSKFVSASDWLLIISQSLVKFRHHGSQLYTCPDSKPSQH